MESPDVKGRGRRCIRRSMSRDSNRLKLEVVKFLNSVRAA
jgi:hypothetical protein